MGDLEEYVRSVEQSLQSEAVDPDSLAAGQHEGLRAAGLARLTQAADETEKHHSGYLMGHLVRWLCTHGRAFDRSILGVTLYGAAMGHAEAQRALSKDAGLLEAHLYATITAEKRLQTALTDSDERMVFAWLCEQADVAVTLPMVARLERLRSARHEKYGLMP